MKYPQATRAHVAWLLWCANQGYILAEDRAVINGNNHFLKDPADLHPDDLAQRPGWMEMADQVLAAIDAEFADRKTAP